MKSLQIVDAHHHLWDYDRHHYPKLFTGSKRTYGDMADLLAQKYLVDDLRREAHNWDLVKSVHIQCSYDPQEIVWLQALADDPANAGFPHGIVSFIDFLSAGIERVLEDQATFRNFRGARNTVAAHADAELDRPHKYFFTHERWRKNIGLLTRHNASLDIAVYASQMADLATLARRHAGLQFILCHAGYPVVRTPDELGAWQTGMALLATCPNIAVKLSGFGIFDANWTTASIRPLIEHIVDKFGTGRCMFASNFPVDRVFSDYDRIWNSFVEITRNYSDDEKFDLLRGSAERLYRI